MNSLFYGDTGDIQSIQQIKFHFEKQETGNHIWN